MLTVDGDAVEIAIREVSRAEVEPRFRALADDEVFEKSPGDLVTAADRGCEQALSLRLRTIAALPVVGEEATAGDPGLADLVAEVDAVWVVDPVDGTANFVAGSPDHAIMVALVQQGRTTHGWMYLPASASMLSAELGAGAFRDGRHVVADTPAPGAVGLLKRGFLPERTRQRVERGPDVLRSAVHGSGCCPVDYGAVVTGAAGFAIYWRTLPWDHAAPALFATESGLDVARPGGGPYLVGDGGSGLIVAHPSVWDSVDAAFATLA